MQLTNESCLLVMCKLKTILMFQYTIHMFIRRVKEIVMKMIMVFFTFFEEI